MAEKQIERIGKVLFLPEDVEIVTVTITRKIPYTPEEISKLEKYEPTYTQVHTSCFNAYEIDGYDAITGNGFILDENDEWHLVGAESQDNSEKEENEKEENNNVIELKETEEGQMAFNTDDWNVKLP